MKIKKTLLLYLFATFIISIFFATNYIRAEENQSFDIEHDIIYDINNDFLGVNLKNTNAGALKIKVKDDLTVTTSSLGLITIELPQSLDTTLSKGLLIKVKGPASEMGFRMYMEDQDGLLFRTFTGSLRSDIFILEDGTVSQMEVSGSSHRLTANMSGTLYLPWNNVVTAAAANSMPEGTIITKLFIAVDMRSTGNAGKDIAISAIATVKTEDSDVTVTKVLNTSELNYSNDANNTTADVNLIDISKGKMIYSNDSITGFHNLNGEINADTVVSISNWTYERSPIEIKLNYVDINGDIIKAPNSLELPYSDSVDYEILPEIIPGYTYFDSDKALVGFIDNSIVIKLTYVLGDYQPDMDYEIIYDDNDNFIGVNLTDSIEGSFKMRVKNQINLTEDSFGLVTIKFHEVIDTTLSDGLLIRFVGPNVGGMGFRMFMEDDDGLLLRTFTGTEREDVFILTDGTVTEMAVSGSAHRLSQNMSGTLFLPWNKVVKAIGATAMPNGTNITKLFIAVDMRTGGNIGKEITIGTIATVRAGESSVFLTKVINTAQLSYSYNSDDTTSDVNLLDITKGTTIFSNDSVNKVHVLNGAEHYETINAIGNLSFIQNAFEILVRYVNEEGQDLISSAVFDSVWDDDKYIYQITAPTIIGYIFKSSNFPLSGTVIENKEIILTYEIVKYNITIIYKDKNDNVIADSEILLAPYRNIYQIKPKTIEGYTYDSAAGVLTATAVRDTEITLYYTKESKGCKGFIDYGSVTMLLIFATLATIFFSVKRNKYNSDLNNGGLKRE